MDRHALAIMIPVMVVFFTGLALLSRTAIGKALAHRISGDGSTTAALNGEIQELRAELEGLRGDLLEMHERIDFTERQLASGRRDG
jgi:adenylylsulfate kinase-like enzyme